MSFLTSLRPPPLSSPSPIILRSLARPLHRPFTTTAPSRLARITIVGRLADDPEVVPTSTGQDVVRYALATNTGKGENRQTSWWRVSSFMPEGSMRDFLVGSGKGSLLCVEGDCSMKKYTTKDGVNTSALSILQKTFEVLDRKNPRGEEQMEGEGEGEGQMEEGLMERE